MRRRVPGFHPPPLCISMSFPLSGGVDTKPTPHPNRHTAQASVSVPPPLAAYSQNFIQKTLQHGTVCYKVLP